METGPQIQTSPARVGADQEIRISIDRSSDARDDRDRLPTPPASSAPAVFQDSPRTAFDTSELQERVDSVLQSDIGVNTLLNRLKQSIASAKEFSNFLKERSTLEEKHANGLKKLSRATHDLIRRPESRQGSFAQSYEEITGIHDRMSDHGIQFALSLHQMSDDLQELASNIERKRKHWKHIGLNSEQRLQDAENATAKAKTKYDVLAEQYDRARTGDRQSGRFGLKQKSAAQQEEDLNRKVQAADADYASKVQAARASRQELITSLRPQAVRALTELIMECDSCLTFQLQKFASLNEKVLLGKGLCVSPLKNPNGTTPDTRSLREVAHNIDNEKDFTDYILSFSNKAGTRTSDIKYEKHPSLASPKQAQPKIQAPLQPSFNSTANGYPNQNPAGPNPPRAYETGHRASQSGQISGVTPYQPLNRDNQAVPIQQEHYSSGPVPPTHSHPPQSLVTQIPHIPSYSPIKMSSANLEALDGSSSAPPPDLNTSDRLRSGTDPSPVLPREQRQYRDDVQSGHPQRLNNYFQSSSHSQPSSHGFHSGLTQHSVPAANIGQPRRSEGPRTDLPPLNPVFGVTLDELFRRDGTAVPSIVHQCTIAVELFGLEVEGIYRTSGSNPHIMEMKAMFDNDSSQVDFRNPTAFHHDIASVTTLLKHFLRDLPDPLLTSANYTAFLTAAKIDDDIHRRDSLHAIINDLPDPNYATLRQLTLHLHKVAEHSAQNRMTPGNLAIVFGPTLMGLGGAAGAGDVRDAALQAKVVETIILNTFQIFDDDD